jgi:tripartite-type tricarboxylate transporter receptor subunit TctC
MNRRRALTRAIAASAIPPLVTPFAARAQDRYPSRPITLIVPFPPGIVDSKARIVAGKVAEILGQPLVVENKAGAGQRIGTLALARAPRDGYTIGVITQAGAVMAPAIDPASLKYDYQKDFQYLTFGYAGPFMLATHAKSGFRTMKEFVALARSRPGQLKFSSSGVGTSYHVWSEVFFDKAGVQLLHVPYRGAAQAQTDLIGGQVDVMLTSAGAYGEVNAGLLMPLGVSSEVRLPALAQVPTFRELGIDIAFESWLGFAAPAGIPAQALERLNAAFKQALENRDVREKIGGDGSEVRYTTPAEFTRVIEGEVRTVAEINKRLKLELQ